MKKKQIPNKNAKKKCKKYKNAKDMRPTKQKNAKKKTMGKTNANKMQKTCDENNKRKTNAKKCDFAK